MEEDWLVKKESLSYELLLLLLLLHLLILLLLLLLLVACPMSHVRHVQCCNEEWLLSNDKREYKWTVLGWIGILNWRRRANSWIFNRQKHTYSDSWRFMGGCMEVLRSSTYIREYLVILSLNPKKLKTSFKVQGSCFTHRSSSSFFISISTSDRHLDSISQLGQCQALHLISSIPSKYLIPYSSISILY